MRGSLSISLIIFVMFTTAELTSFCSSDAEYKVLVLQFSTPWCSGDNWKHIPTSQIFAKKSNMLSF